MTISGFVAYVKQLWKNKPDASTPISAERLLHMESGIKGNSDAIEKLAAAVVNQIVNDPNKIAGMAALFAVNEKVTKLNSDLNVLLKTETVSASTGEIASLGTDTVNITFDIPAGYRKLTAIPYCGNGWGKPSFGDWSGTAPTQSITVFNGASGARTFDIFVFVVYVKTGFGI